jgi:pantothenate kinase
LHRADGWAAVADAFDEGWFMETPLATALQRLMVRHMASWNLTLEQAAARIDGNDRLNAEIVLATRARAGWLLSGEAPLGR